MRTASRPTRRPSSHAPVSTWLLTGFLLIGCGATPPDESLHATDDDTSTGAGPKVGGGAGSAGAGGATGAPASAGGGGASSSAPPASGPTTTVHPAGSDAVLTNPGMGFADFGQELPLDQYPATSVMYERWTWAKLEPMEGKYAFDIIDAAVAEAKAKKRTLAFRVMPVYSSSSPAWLATKGVGMVKTNDGTFPDHNHPAFLAGMQKLVEALGQRYAGSADIDHVDIGSVGCWGEWNTACCSDKATCKAYYPTVDNQHAIIDWYFESFAGTPLVALLETDGTYAESKGSGWRGDCFGDYGFYSSTWNHMVNSYGPAATDPVIGTAWKHAPVQFESCGVIQDWADEGYDIDMILDKGLEWHMSVLNAKSSPIPPQWRSKVDAFLKKVGYRLTVKTLAHTSQIKPGESIAIDADWENQGVAPPYHAWKVAYRLRGAGDDAVTTWVSSADIRHPTSGVGISS